MSSVDKTDFIFSLSANSSNICLSSGCMSPGITKEWRGVPMSVVDISSRVAATIFWSCDPTLATATQMESAVNAVGKQTYDSV